MTKYGYIKWTDSVIWVPSLRHHLANTYYFTSRMMPIYAARRLNATGFVKESLPSLGPNDFIYNPSFRQDLFQDEWLLTMQAITTGSNSTRVEFGQREWENSVNETSVQCFKQAVHITSFPAGVCFFVAMDLLDYGFDCLLLGMLLHCRYQIQRLQLRIGKSCMDITACVCRLIIPGRGRFYFGCVERSEGGHFRIFRR
jgi:hypothetical protein